MSQIHILSATPLQPPAFVFIYNAHFLQSNQFFMDKISPALHYIFL